jgi:sugar lactone lactonase YvrE
MATRSWIRRLFDRKPRTLRKAPARHRPALEMLEDRTVFSATPTSLALSVSSLAPVYGQSETLTAVVTTPNGDPTPTASDGTVSFYAGTTLLGSATLSGSPATASLTTTALPGGTDYVTARYSGDSSFAASTTVVGPQSTVAVVPASGIGSATGVAVDGAGDVFLADTTNNRVVEVKPGAAPVTIASGLNGPQGVAVDGAGDVFIADAGNNQVLEVKPGAAPTPFVTGLSGPQGVAVDGAGNVYIADTGNNRVLKVTADGSQQASVGANLSGPTGVAVDGQGDVFIADAGHQQVVEVVAAGGTPSVLPSPGLLGLNAVAVDAQGDLFLTSGTTTSVLELTADGTQVPLGAGTFVQPYGLAVDGQGDVFVTDTGRVGLVQEINAGVAVTLSPAPTTLSLSAASSTLYNGQSATFTATLTTPTGAVPSPGDGTVTFYNGAKVLGSAPWSAQGTAVLTTAALPVGTSLSVSASYSGDNNFQPSHFGIQTASPQVVLPGFANFQPTGVAVDAQGDVFAADPSYGFLEEVKADGTVTTFGSGLQGPGGVAVDVGGDVFVTEAYNADVLEMTPGSTTPTTVASGLNGPRGVAVDSAGDVFIADYFNSRVLEVKPDHTTSTWGSGLYHPEGVAVDGQGDVFIADTGNNRVVEVTPSGTQTTLGPVIVGPSWLHAPSGVAVDGVGDVFIADQGNNRVVELQPNGGHTTVGSGLTFAYGVGVDGQGDVLIADSGNGRVVEVTPRVNVTVVAPTPTAITLSVASQALTYGQTETITATVTVPSGAAIPGSGDGTITFYDGSTPLGTFTLSGSPATATLTTAPLAPGMHDFTATYSGDSSFLPSSSGVEPNSALSLVGNNQINTPYSMAADGNGDVFIADAATNLSYLSGKVWEVKPDGTQSVVFDATLPGPYQYKVGAYGLAVDSAGDLFVAAGGNAHLVQKITPSGTVTTAISGPMYPIGVAVDTAGDLFIGDALNSQVLELTSSGTLSVVVKGLNLSAGAGGRIAVDSAGDVFVADCGNSRVLEVKPDGSVSTVGSGLNGVTDVAVDGQGDVFIADTLNHRLLEVKPDGSQVTLFSSNYAPPRCVAVDGQGDVFFGAAGQAAKLTPGVPVSVTVPTVISVSASSTAPLYGQGVTFTATVTVPSGAPIPTAADGTVTFYDGSTALGTATLSGSPATATLTTAALAAGAHAITATYSGDNSFQPCTSGVEPTSAQAGVAVSGLNFPTSVALDSTGAVFVADSGNNRVVVPPNTATEIPGTANHSSAITPAVDAQGDLFLVEGSSVVEVKPDGTQITVASGLAAVGVAVDGQGDLFIADRGKEQVVEVKPDGTQTTVATGFNYDNLVVPQLVVDGQGDLFITDPSNNRVVEVKPGGSATNVGSGLGFPDSVAVDGQGDLFIADYGNSRVVEVTPSATQTTFVSGLKFPESVAVDGQGDVFIADTNNNRVLKVKPGGSPTTIFQGGLPVQVVADSQGDVFIQSYQDTALYEVTASGTLITIPNVLSMNSNGIAVDGHGHVFISTGYAVLEVFPAGGQISPASGLNHPFGVAVQTTAGSIQFFIADTNNNRVVEVSPYGPETPVGSGLNAPQGVALDGAGDAFIADTGNNRVVEVTPSGTQTTVAAALNAPAAVMPQGAILRPLMPLGQSFPGFPLQEIPPASWFNTPSTVLDDTGGTFIADSGNNRVVEIKPDGSQVTIGTGLKAPTGVAVDLVGDVFIADSGNNRVVEVTPVGTQITVASGLNNPQGVAVIPIYANVYDQYFNLSYVPVGDDLVIADSGNNRVLELTPGVAVTVRVPTSISVSASSATAVYGQSVTLTATVTVPSGDPTPTAADGTVRFYDGTTLLGTATLSVSPTTASLTTAALAAGAHSITAVYSGDSSFQPSSSANLPVTVSPAPTAISVSVSNAMSTFGQSLTFTATVTTAAGEPIPSSTDGTVTFYDGAKALGSATLSGSPATATLSTTVLTAGQHTITARYSGDTSFATTQSGVEPTSTQVVVLVGRLAGLPPVAHDGQGDFFFADPTNSRVLEVKADGTLTTVGSGLVYPSGVAVDLQGDVFIDDAGLYEVVEVLAGLPVTVSQANAGAQVTGYSIIYDGNSHTATGSATDVNGNALPASDFNLTATTHTTAGTYSTDAWSFHDPSGNYLDASGTVSDSISPATPTLSVSDAGGTYNGKAFAATDSVAGVVAGVDNTPASTLEGVTPTLTYYAGTYTLATLPASGGSSTAPSAAGNYTVVASFAGSTDYSSNQALATFTIAQASPTVQVTDAGGTYDQKPFAATATVAGVNGISGPSLEGVTPTLTYYAGGTPLPGAPLLPGTYTVLASFAGSPDYTAASATAAFTIKTPTTSLSGPTLGVPGQPLTYTCAVHGPTQGLAFSINYGDGTKITTSAGGPSVKLDHLYTATGTFTIQVTAKDANGVVSQLATQSVQVSTVALEPDPSGGTALAVGGHAAGGDTITVSAANTSGKTVSVNVDGTPYGTFTPTGHILVYGQGGKDKITLKPYVVGNTNYYIEVPALLYGEGSGGDKISAGGSAATNVLSGHGTNEVLTGGHGRDLLIGGTGAATLNAGVGDDILIGGWTNYDLSSSGLTYDQKLAALYAILAEWGSADSYATRLSALAGYLSSTTVHDNYATGVAIVDHLLGNAKANDWFFAGVNDAVKGKNNNDVTTLIQ